MTISLLRKARLRHGRILAVVASLVCVAAPPASTTAEALPRIELLTVDGRIIHPHNLSAVETIGDRLVIASDEGSRIQLLEPIAGIHRFRAAETGIELDASGGELDIEGLARDGDTIYAIGSHSLKRRRIQPRRSRSDNAARLATVARDPGRYQVFRLRLDPKSNAILGEVESVSLRPILEADPVLAPFTAVPAQENGVDIEGLAVHDGRLYAGFRSPVLRGGFVPVMVFAFDAPEKYELRFVQLGGKGIRSLASVAGGFLVLSRRERDGKRPSELWFWDGRDQIPGRRHAVAALRHLGEWPIDTGWAEGFAVVSETETEYRLVGVHDGVAGGNPARVWFPRAGK